MDKITTTIKREWLKKNSQPDVARRVPGTQALLDKAPISSSGPLFTPADQRNAAECAGDHRNGNEGQEELTWTLVSTHLMWSLRS
jgi:hypothetical protein